MFLNSFVPLVSVCPQVLLYVYGLISPFLAPSEEEDEDPQDEEDGSSDEDEEDMEIAVNGHKPEPAGGKKKRRGKRQNMQWLPHESTLKLAIDPRLQARMDAAKEVRSKNKIVCLKRKAYREGREPSSMRRLLLI
jgi:hypothetical protein